MHMLVSVLQNRLKPIWPSLYQQLQVASHQDGPSTASPSTAGGRGCPPGSSGRRRLPQLPERHPQCGYTFPRTQMPKCLVCLVAAKDVLQDWLLPLQGQSWPCRQQEDC